MNRSVLDTPLPQNYEAERSVLGSILIDNDIFYSVDTVISAQDFFHTDHREIYRAIGRLLDGGHPADLITLKNEIAASDLPIESSLITALVDGIPDVANASRYAKIVAEKARQRRLITSLYEGMKTVASDGSANVAAKLLDILTPVASDTDKVDIVYAAELMTRSLLEIQERYESRNFFTGIRTGMESLDDYLSGYQRGVLHLIGAYTSHGKTTLGLDLNLKMLRQPDNRNVHSFYFALEMTSKMLAFRLLANEAQQNLYFVRSGNLTEEGLDAVAEASTKIGKLDRRLGICDNAFTLRQIATTARALKRKGMLDVLWVDYLQLIEGIDSEETRQREVDIIGKTLLRLAKELNIAVIAFCQLNEGAVNRKDHEPLLSDMRESRAINQHARTVMLLNRPWMFEKGEGSPYKPCQSYMKIEKNSEGRTGRFDLHFDGKFQKFTEGSCYPGCEHFGTESNDSANEDLDRELTNYRPF